MLLFDYTEEPLYLPEQKPWLPGVKPVAQELEIDWTNPLAEGLYDYYLNEPTGYRCLVTHKPMTKVGTTIAPTISKLGVSKERTTGSGYYTVSKYTNVVYEPWSFYGEFIPTTNHNNSFALFSCGDSPADTKPLMVLTSSDTTDNIRLYIDNSFPAGANFSVTQGEIYRAAVAYDGDYVGLFVNGERVYYASHALLDNTLASYNFYIGMGYNAGHVAILGDACWWKDRALSYAEGVSLTRDGPYQLLKPKAQKIQVPYTPDPALSLPNPRWERPEMLLPARKPTGRPKIDWTHKLAKGLEVCVLFDNEFWDYKSEKVLGADQLNLAGGASYYHITQNGVTYHSNLTYRARLEPWDGRTGGFSMLAGFITNSTDHSTAGTFHPIAGTGFVDGPALMARCYTASANGGPGIFIFSDYCEFTGVGSVTSNTPYILGASIAEGTSSNRMVSLKNVATNTYYGTVSQSSKNNSTTSGEFSVTGVPGEVRDTNWFFYYQWDRELSKSELEYITNNPYSFLIPA